MGYVQCSWTPATYDDSGYNNYTDVFNNAVNNFARATVIAGIFRSFVHIEHRLIVLNQVSDYKTAMLI